ncbi:MAG: metalloregulator ArsR/SmtB family transcription factor [Bacteroidota bacterium]
MRLKNFSLTYGTQIFKAFSDEARVRIIHLLHSAKELSISDLELILEFTQTKTSRHITYLKNSGLLNSRKQDQWVLYSIKEEVSFLVTDIISFIQKDQTLIKDLEVHDTMKANRELATKKIESKDYRI